MSNFSKSPIYIRLASLFATLPLCVVSCTSSGEKTKPDAAKLALVQKIGPGKLTVSAATAKQIEDDAEGEMPGKGRAFANGLLVTGAIAVAGGLGGAAGASITATQLVQGGAIVSRKEKKATREQMLSQARAAFTTFHTNFRRDYQAAHPGALAQALRANPQTASRTAASAGYKLDCTLQSVYYEEKKDQLYLCVELAATLRSPSGEVLLTTEAYGESFNQGAPITKTLAELLQPSTFNAHVKATAASAAASLAEVVVEELGWE